MLRIILPAIGILLALMMPRFKYVSLSLSGALLALLAGGGFWLSLDPPLWQLAPVAALLVAIALLLTRLLPRLILLLALIAAFLTLAGPMLIGHRLGGLIAAGAFALLLIPSVMWVRFGLRLFWALLGAMLMLGGSLSEKPLIRLGAWLAIGLGLFIANWVTSRMVEYKDPEWKESWKIAWISGVSTGLLLFAATTAIIYLPGKPPSRRAAAAPGGIVWPLPSEAILWGDTEFPAFDNLDALYLTGVETCRPYAPPGTSPLFGRVALNDEIQSRRQIKDAVEIAALKKASDAIVAALLESRPLFKVGGTEAAIMQSVQSLQLKHGCEADSFPPIVAAGKNGLDFHYMKNSATLAAGDLVVVDIGCYAGHYASDFARTLPVDGRFTPRQRKLYSALYEAHQAAAKACGPGVKLYGRAKKGEKPTLNETARDSLKKSRVPDDFGHGIGHPLGLFVHDVFESGAPLKPGMVIMIEPGIYLEKEGIAMRLEDAYLVTESGCELLTTGFPADPDSIERLMAESRASQ